MISRYKKHNFFTIKKIQKRGIGVILYAFSNLSNPLFNIILSTILIKKISISFWGEYVAILLLANLFIIILGWGNKEFLLREFSRNPSKININWQTNLIQRFLLCFILIIFLYFFFDYSRQRVLLIVLFILSSFLYKSFEVLVLFKKAFLFSTILEITGYIFLIGMITLFSSEKFSIDLLLLLMVTMMIFKCMGTLWYFRFDIFPLKYSYNFFSSRNTLLLALPFFLPSLVGLIQAKIDLYCSIYFLSKYQVGEYQVYMNLLSIPHVAATYIIMPFIKNIYRLPIESINKIITRLSQIGIICSLPVILIIYIIIHKYYQFSFSIWMYVLGYLQLIPFFIYIFKIHLLFRFDQQKIIIWITLITALFGFIISILFIPYWKIEGAISANLLTQWLTLLFFVYSNRYIKSHE